MCHCWSQINTSFFQMTVPMMLSILDKNLNPMEWMESFEWMQLSGLMQQPQCQILLLNPILSASKIADTKEMLVLLFAAL